MTYRFGFLVFPDVQQLDLTGPYEVFASVPGAEVNLFWKDTAQLATATGLILTPTLRLDDCTALDVLCIPGGRGVNALLGDAEVLDWVRRQATQARFVTSVCTGALVLGAAGLLQGLRATTHWYARDFLPCFGAIPTEGRIVRDGNVITGGGVTAGLDVGLAVIGELLGQNEAETIQLIVEYAPAPPYCAGTPEGAREEILSAAQGRLAVSRRERELILGDSIFAPSGDRQRNYQF